MRAFGSRNDRPSPDDEQGDDPTSSGVDGTESTGASAEADSATQKNPQRKGRPTPKRRDQERARGMRSGPVAPPVTRKEARQRRKSNEAGMSKEERKAHRAQLKEQREERRRLMIEGDDRYVLARDRGEVRRYTRDWVDTTRRFSNFFMPLAFALIIAQLVPIDQIRNLALSGFWLFLLLVITDGVLVGRTVNRNVRELFPESDETGFSLGFYAAMRASQPRMLRTPRPRLRPGDQI